MTANTFFKKLDDNGERWLLLPLYALIVITIFVEVFRRFALSYSSIWAEEIARYAFIYVSWIGASAAIKERYLTALGKDTQPDAWDFLIGDETNINQLTGALGFQYFYIEETQEFAHPAVIFVLTEEGVVSRYLYGIEFREQDLRLALLEASEGKIGNTIDRLILFCYHYDPDAEGYVVFAANIMKLGGIATVIILGLFLGILWGRERHRKAKI